MEIKPFSMKATPEQSRIVQKFLFANGYCWRGGDKKVSGINFPYLIFREHSSGTLLLTADDTPNSKVPLTTFEEFKNLYMTPKTLEITPDKVLSAAKKCPQAKEVLQEMFPEVFEDDKLTKVGFTNDFIEIRNYEDSEYHKKAFWLSKCWNWEIKEDNCGSLCLIPTKKS